mmetsp:Transcript_15870/g.21781  ORF Transcript_15870/g.21781 Transcript_15870/m.21781 type:complete len:219 (-) Transcript_15870:762-1418(-)
MVCGAVHDSIGGIVERRERRIFCVVRRGRWRTCCSGGAAVRCAGHERRWRDRQRRVQRCGCERLREPHGQQRGRGGGQTRSLRGVQVAEGAEETDEGVRERRGLVSVILPRLHFVRGHDFGDGDRGQDFLHRCCAQHEERSEGYLWRGHSRSHCNDGAQLDDGASAAGAPSPPVHPHSRRRALPLLRRALGAGIQVHGRGQGVGRAGRGRRRAAASAH